MTRFFITATLVSAVILIGGYVSFETLPAFFYPTVIFLFISTVGLYKFLLDIKQNKPDLFVTIYLGTLAMKLIGYGAYIVVMIKKQPEMMTENVVFFMIGYVIFTGLETGFLYRFISR